MQTGKQRKIYPDPFASEAEKKSYGYGLKIGKLIKSLRDVIWVVIRTIQKIVL